MAHSQRDSIMPYGALPRNWLTLVDWSILFLRLDRRTRNSFGLKGSFPQDGTFWTDDLLKLLGTFLARWLALVIRYTSGQAAHLGARFIRLRGHLSILTIRSRTVVRFREVTHSPAMELSSWVGSFSTLGALLGSDSFHLYATFLVADSISVPVFFDDQGSFWEDGAL